MAFNDFEFEQYTEDLLNDEDDDIQILNETENPKMHKILLPSSFSSDSKIDCIKRLLKSLKDSFYARIEKFVETEYVNKLAVLHFYSSQDTSPNNTKDLRFLNENENFLEKITFEEMKDNGE